LFSQKRFPPSRGSPVVGSPEMAPHNSASGCLKKMFRSTAGRAEPEADIASRALPANVLPTMLSTFSKRQATPVIWFSRNKLPFTAAAVLPEA
jgi:hypothetical protein